MLFPIDCCEGIDWGCGLWCTPTGSAVPVRVESAGAARAASKVVSYEPTFSCKA